MTAAASDALIWIEPEQMEFARAVCEAAGAKIARLGSPAPGKTRELAEALGAEPVDDLRSSLLQTEKGLVLLGTTAGLADAGDAEPLLACADRGVAVCSLEPLPASILHVQRPDLGGRGGENEGMGVAIGPEPIEQGSAGDVREWAEFVPLARLSKSVQDASEVITQLGQFSMVSVQAFSGPGQGSLGARLYDAIATIVWLMGQPDRVDAAYVPPASLRGRGVHALPSDSLRGLHGDMCANLRFADGRAAAIVASSHAGRWSRAVTLVGERGRVRIFDDGLEWIGPDGKLIDASRDAARVRGSSVGEGAIAGAVRAVTEQVGRLIDHTKPASAPTNVVGVLSTAGAALLSARTGEGESPDTILRMARTA